MSPERTFWTGLGLGVLVGLSACSKPAPPTGPLQDLSDEAACATPALKLNEVQSVGSHNSYKRAIPYLEMGVLRRASEEVAIALDYAHAPLHQQLDLGMRQLELDVFHDPDGGRYSNPFLPDAIPWIGTRYNVPNMDLPGFKVMHVQDLDQRSHCTLFTDCLADILAWSNAHPEHTPLLIMVNAKQDKIDLEEAVVPLPFTPAAFEALDAEILSVIPADKLITPDQVRGDEQSLREAVLAGGWPNYHESKGKFIFVLDESPDVIETYLRGHSALEGLPMFVNSISEDADHAAYFTLNDPIEQATQIRKAIAAGFLVRTRADANTLEARNNDTARREAAFTSGAQYISTDYYHPRKKFSDYTVTLPNAAATRCRPEEPPQ